MTYTEADIVEGGRVLRNGAVAGYVHTPEGLRWRIVSSNRPRQRGGSKRRRYSPRTLKNKHNKRFNTSPRRKQRGGSKTVSLKTAVRLLRSYYANKF